MANFKPENVKRFVENISKEVAENAYNGGGGSIDGVYVLPRTFITQEALEITDYDIDYEKVVEWFEKIGIDLDSPIIREDDIRVFVKVCLNPNTMVIGGTDAGSIESLINIQLVHNQIDTTKYNFEFSFDSILNRQVVDYIPAEGELITLRRVLSLLAKQSIAIPSSLATLDSILVGGMATRRLFSNEFFVYRLAINDIEYGLVHNVDSMVKDIVIPYGSGSGSGSSE